MLRRAFVLLGGTFGLAACGTSNTGPYSGANQPVGQSLAGTPPPGLMQGPPVTGPVAILLPLTGRMADVGRPMLRAAQLALSVPGSPPLDVKDTKGTPEGAVQA